MKRACSTLASIQYLQQHEKFCEKGLEFALISGMITADLEFPCQTSCVPAVVVEVLIYHELSSKGGVLLLAQVVMRLDVSPSVTVSSSIVAAVSRLKSKVLSILLNLCEAESLSYLDEVASTPASLDLAKSIALEVLNLLKKMFGTDFQHSVAPSDKIYPKGQLQLNAMRLADIFSDDSNFRSFITNHFTEVLTEIFSVAHGEFISTWCSSNLPIREEDATLEYDPFTAAGWVLDLFQFSDQLNAMSTESTFVPSNVPRLSYPHQRTSLLVKVLANLHCFVPDICKEEKDLFLNKFVQCLRTKVSETSEGFKSISDPQKEANVSRNLGSLLSHAESLIPTFLNEDDVQLLRVFITQLESLITPRAFGENRVQPLTPPTWGGAYTASLQPPLPPLAHSAMLNFMI
ncbi:hypothetical protein HAX54_017455 [Datura stramonium]|uniref:Nodulin homeobox N-terminal domain-containing protein n=1 Tax=Datura stramonium TaxID=4076 RepID=A0ABS8UKT0_DATST|nr:hypothetical protein [Datura stramonium]